MLWWQSEDYVGDISQVLAHANEAFSRTATAPSVHTCDLCFKALNTLWNARARHDAEHKLADTPAFTTLLQGISHGSADELLQNTRLRELVELTPQVMNHRVLKEHAHQPGRRIPEDLRNKATECHRRLARSYKSYITTRMNRDQLLKRVAELLYVIRSNIAHGEKTPYGPDLEKAARDAAVSALALPLLRLIILVLLDRPDHKLLSYGTLTPGGPNASQLSGIAGTWTSCTVPGRIDMHEGLAFLRHDIKSERIPAHLLRSPELENHWPHLDRFEGERYRRTLLQVNVAGVWEIASAYSAA
jgi:gamma-glutamylcyclotransferase (GGCT)/AIG2-like uncharacterized protein YtfP